MHKLAFSKILFYLGFLVAIFYPKAFTMILNQRIEYPGFFFEIYQWHSHEMIYGFFGIILLGIFYSPLFQKPKAPEKWISLFFIFLFILERVSLIFPIQNIYIPLLFGVNFWLFSLLFLGFNYSSMANLQKKVFWIYFLFIVSKFFFLSGIYFQNAIWIKKTQLISLELIRLSIFFLLPKIIRIENGYHGEEDRAQKFISNLSVIPSLLIILLFLFNQENPIIALVYSFMIIIHLIRAFGIIDFKEILTLKNCVLFSVYDFALLGPLFYILVLFWPNLDQGRPMIHSLTTGAVGVFALSLFYLFFIQRNNQKSKWFAVAYIFVVFGSLLRIFTPIFSPGILLGSLHWSSGFWVSGFLLILLRFFKELSRGQVESPADN